MNLANTNVKLDSNGYLLVALGGGLAVADSIKLDSTNLDVILSRRTTGLLGVAGGTAGGVVIANGASFTTTEYGGLSWISNVLWLNTTTNGGSARNLTLGAASAVSVAPTNGSAQYIFANGGVTAFSNLTTVARGVPCVVAQARAAAVTNTGTASIATFTVGAADGTFQVSGNALVTTSNTHSFSLDCTYTDEGNNARTLVLPIAQLAGAFITAGLITNVTGVGPYETAIMHIRAKAATAITIRTSAGGTFTDVVYNVDGTIKQLA